MFCELLALSSFFFLFLYYNVKYCPLLSPPSSVDLETAQQMPVFLENVMKLSPKLGHCCCNIFALREDLAKNNRAEGQLLFQGKKNPETSQGLCLSLHQNTDKILPAGPRLF